jgi:hypothetical protein
MTHIRTSIVVAAGMVMAAGAASGQILLDGDMEALSIGTPPDCDQAAGAWEFPENYVVAGVCEPAPDAIRIESDPFGRGQSLLLKYSDALANIHVTNRFTRTINEGEGIVIVHFDIFVTGGFGGGAVYVGGDHGGGGFDALRDRGPQLAWDAAGQISTFEPGQIVRTDYKQELWQRVRLDIDLASDTWELYHTNDISVPPTLVAQDLAFRSTALTHLDRFSIAHFGAFVDTNVAFFDNITVDVEPSGCYADCDGSGELDFFDFLCFQNAFAAGEPYADCDGSGSLDFFDFLCFQNEFAAGCP